MQENAVGTKIVTQSLTNEYELDDITDNYKIFRESSNKNIDLEKRSKDDVHIQLNLPNDNQVKVYQLKKTFDKFSFFCSLGIISY